MNRNRRIPVCVFTKPPKPGDVKTRLIPLVGSEGAAILASSFFEDVWATICSLEWADPIVASMEAMTFSDTRTVWLQSDGDLGKKMEVALRSALHRKTGAFVLGSDLPGLPVENLNSAYQALSCCDAVLGPCDDGGFYLLGLSRCPEGLLSGIRWSEPDTFLQTFTKLRQADMTVTVVQRWFDVDRPQDLIRLRSLLESKTIIAPFTKRAFERLRVVHA